MLELFHEKYYSGHPFAGAYHPRDDPWCVDHGGVHGIVLGILKDAQAKADHTSVLFASGMIVGESIIGVLIAMVVVFAVSNGGSADPLALVGADFAPVADILSVIAFASIIVVFIYRTIKSSK